MNMIPNWEPSSIPANAHAQEHAMLDCIIESEGRQRGSIMTQIAIFQSKVDTGMLLHSFLLFFP